MVSYKKVVHFLPMLLFYVWISQIIQDMEHSFHTSIDTELKLKIESVVMSFEGTCLCSCIGLGRKTAQYEFGIMPSYSEQIHGARHRPAE